MTSYGPPKQPPGPPPPPPGSHGSPPAAGGSARFDLKTVNPLDWGILAAGVLALIFSFFKYYSYKPNVGPLEKALGVSAAQVRFACSHRSLVPSASQESFDAVCKGTAITTSGWNGFFGWFGVLLALIGAALIALAIFAPQVKLRFAARLGSLAAFALAVISTLIALLVIPNYAGVDTSSLRGAGVSYDDVVDEGHSFSYWIVLILIVVGLVLTFLRFQQTDGQLSAWRGSTNALGSPGGQPPGSGVPGPQPPAGAPPQPGYGAPPQPPPQPGYGAPPPPPPPQ